MDTLINLGLGGDAHAILIPEPSTILLAVAAFAVFPLGRRDRV
jgi:hypothetical protein